MVVGIVGSEKIKFGPAAEAAAKELIHKIIQDSSVTEVVSGACHLGGVDIWAAKIGRKLGRKVTEFEPKLRGWSSGYKPRNLEIARASDIVHCITVKSLPSNYAGMRFDFCYHCNSDSHVKSGGCWTMKQAILMGKLGKLHIIEQ